MKKVIFFLIPLFTTIFIFAISLVVMLSLQSMFSLPQYTDVRNVRFVYTIAITASITVVFVGLAYRFIHRLSIKKMGLHWNKQTSILSLVAILIIITGFILYTVYVISNGYVSIRNNVEYVPIIIMIILYIGVSINEEVLFRGYLHRFYREHNIVVAYLISIPLFLLPHFLNRDFEFSYIVALLSATFLITLLYDLTRSIWSSIVVHTILNIALSLLSTGDNSGSILSLKSTINISKYTEFIRYGEVIINAVAIIAISLIYAYTHIKQRKELSQNYN
ncbi:CPBP family intramembrane glutamic endopeptidase [Peloplasma aerotolerans]|uniref:Type II CAAX endopeptidase family protein n=1 Tax=Peloplasma aerotolerans TaxID=3044389 RepID=A0AAW6U9Z8_9MOLU|nr:type II CAAX endopeptidase family protein [Mariniplasma sp. M4Ah]MDI6453252.1 type II CAAX endopeptidase family protein [Mariniplasma sp. M4Ah]